MSDLGQELSTAIVLFHEAVARRLGLNAAEHKALGVIARSGPLPTGALAPQLGVGVSAVTGIVDRLEHAGYVRREPDPTDRRRVLVVADASRTPDLTGIFADLSKEMATLLTKYDDRELAAIADYLTRMVDVLRAQTWRLAANAE
jgi:DNA-binding MarR family transcriptional regulator